MKDLRHPRKDMSCIRSQARRKAKALGGHCECFEKQAFNIYPHRSFIKLVHNIYRIRIGFRHPRKDKSCISSQAWRKAKALGGHCECFEKQALTFILINRSQQ
ncbi:hypothetical protein F2Q69_00008572 [Brassica cretica]|uniref:Uncharacterized protein n=1 Tax=Brassica cretica TaxID=69181 RepID=A0A8S9P253_BRACR|nr:hypothetical protein F2Q69_00008572 [Brassica cretica]